MIRQALMPAVLTIVALGTWSSSASAHEEVIVDHRPHDTYVVRRGPAVSHVVHERSHLRTNTRVIYVDRGPTRFQRDRHYRRGYRSSGHSRYDYSASILPLGIGLILGYHSYRHHDRHDRHHGRSYRDGRRHDWKGRRHDGRHHKGDRRDRRSRR